MKSFSLPQILLHWIVALLVLLQFLNDDAVGRALRALRRDGTPPGFLASAHVYVGIAILALALWRLALRRTRGAPPPPADEPPLLRLAAAATHALLYLLLLALPLSGLAAWYGGVRPAAGLHETLKPVLLGVVALHVAGALYQAFVLRSDVVARMVRVRPD
ncbi:MAG: cytochrome b/b6 domain-containing protein [Amaricoccus sp.]